MTLGALTSIWFWKFENLSRLPDSLIVMVSFPSSSVGVVTEFAFDFISRQDPDVDLEGRESSGDLAETLQVAQRALVRRIFEHGVAAGDVLHDADEMQRLLDHVALEDRELRLPQEVTAFLADPIEGGAHHDARALERDRHLAE